MPKTTAEIWDDLSIHSQQALLYCDIKYALGSKDIEKKWYSKEEIIKIIEKVKDGYTEVDDEDILTALDLVKQNIEEKNEKIIETKEGGASY